MLILHPNFMEMKQKELKAALFDLDGVVFDTEPQYTIFWGSVCRQYHPEHPGLEQEIKGSTLTQIYERWFSGSLEAAREDVTRRLNDYEQQMHYDFLDGFEQLIRDLHNHGVKTAVLFDAILTSEDFERSKPDPDCYLKAAERLGVKKDECIVFEDSFNGLRSGRAAGMKVVGLATTNSAESISGLSDIQIDNYVGTNYETLSELIS